MNKRRACIPHITDEKEHVTDLASVVEAFVSVQFISVVHSENLKMQTVYHTAVNPTVLQLTLASAIATYWLNGKPSSLQFGYILTIFGRVSALESCTWGPFSNRAGICILLDTFTFGVVLRVPSNVLRSPQILDRWGFKVRNMPLCRNVIITVIRKFNNKSAVPSSRYAVA